MTVLPSTTFRSSCLFDTFKVFCFGTIAIPCFDVIEIMRVSRLKESRILSRKGKALGLDKASPRYKIVVCLVALLRVEIGMELH